MKAKGFTLTELIIVITIIGILTSAVFINFRRQREYVNHSDFLTRTVSLIKEAREYAFTSRAVYDQSKPVGQETYIPPEGYGIYIDLTDSENATMILFGNTSTTAPDEKADQYDSGDIVEETLKVHRDVLLEALQGINLDPPVTDDLERAVILFRPPLAEVTIAENADPSSIPASAPVFYDTLSMTLSRRGSGPTVPDSVISINKTAGFPELQLE